MTGRHPGIHIRHAFEESRAGGEPPFLLARRDFLRLGMATLSGAALSGFLLDPSGRGLAQELKGKRIYIAPDDHTDLFWTADLDTYHRVFVSMLDYYLDLVDKTRNEPTEFQSRWNCDGSYWVWVYERAKPQAEFERLIERIRDGHIGIPLNALCICLGGAPAEAVLRGMYYPGSLERRYSLRFSLAYSMENQTLPLGLGALWAGSGATFSWKGICGCATLVPDAEDREHDIYWWTGMDGSRLLMKWNSMLNGNQRMGGYAEAREPEEIIRYVEGLEEFKRRYPYQVIGAFGYGWDDLESETDEFPAAAKKMTTGNLQVIVSNEMDFAEDFTATHGSEIPSMSVSYGNEWDLDCATMAEVSARVKRAVEALRTAESLASLVCLKKNDFMQGREVSRDRAWMNLGLYWEHDWQGAPWDGLTEKRIAWTRQITGEIEDYVYKLREESLAALGGMIPNPAGNERVFVFNPLSWERTDYADQAYSGSDTAHVVDLESGQELPSQLINKDGKQFLRIWAAKVPPVGYKVYEIRPGAGTAFSPAAEPSGDRLENLYYRLRVDDRGAIASLEDKIRGRELAAEINGRAMNDLGPGAGEVIVENAGPVSVTLLASSKFPLAHTTRVTLFRDSDRVEIQNDITQNFDETQTWAFGFALEDPDIHHEEVGAILRARLEKDGGHYSSRSARYDWLTLGHFVDISQGDKFGVTLSNVDCYFMKTGNSTVKLLDTITPQITILAGGKDMNEQGVLANQGGDEHFLQRFALRTHQGYDPVAAMRFALEHQNPLMAGEVLGGSGYPEKSFSLLEIDNPAVLLWALKPAEEGMQAGLAARVWNLSNEQGRFSLTWNEGGLKAAQQLTHIETPVRDMALEGGSLVDEVTPQQMKTYGIYPAGLPFSPENHEFPATLAAPDTPTAPGSPVVETAAPTTTPTPSQPAGTEGKGCALGLLNALMDLFK